MTALNNSWRFVCDRLNDPTPCVQRMEAIGGQLYAINERRQDGPVVAHTTFKEMLTTDVRNLGLQLRNTDSEAMQLAQQIENERKERDNRNVRGEQRLLIEMDTQISNYSIDEDKTVHDMLKTTRLEVAKAIAMSRIHNIRKTIEDLADIREDKNIIGSWAVLNR
ncbi:hypothetical protein LTS18_001553 [Coniosporium uncinatum]|uniref:Uncharacterized protein n=1 Tax=Coniosporium uncinatum TaxID=93489 RepID=A0ACC3DV46_9PEZI|nr:hypothetical protein LTS18_001553 [Coniosporium uncinatum]